MLVYIAGKMTGLPDKGRKAFEDAEDVLREEGFAVLNPARLPDDLPNDLYMPLCLTMLQRADAIALLPGSEESKGAQIELEFARYQRKTILIIEKIEKRAQIRNLDVSM